MYRLFYTPRIVYFFVCFGYGISLSLSFRVVSSIVFANVSECVDDG